jgi:hypothetical protein
MEYPFLCFFKTETEKVTMALHRPISIFVQGEIRKAVRFGQIKPKNENNFFPNSDSFSVRALHKL